MTERSILFSAAMVRALLSGTKTQTRRALRMQPPDDSGLMCGPYNPTVIRRGEEEPGSETFGAFTEEGSWATPCPYGKPGDRLWVRETFYCDNAFYPDGVGVNCLWREVNGKRAAIPIEEQRAEMLESMYYRADGEPEWEGAEEPTPWRPSIHMPRWASRITLEITEVRVQRLQDISEVDALAEGVEPTVVGAGWRRYDDPDCEVVGLIPCCTPVESYRSLWEHLSGPDSWDANPWVWAISFKRLTP